MINLPRKTTGAIVCFILIALIGIYYFVSGPQNPELKDDVTDHKTDEALQINGRKVIGIPAGKVDLPKDLKISNTVSNNWKEQLEKDLKSQGGDSIKEIQIKKEASLVWLQNDVGINVESVKVSIKNTNNEEVLFRALVDSQNGKILETWDRPIEDLSNPKKNFRLKLDPRNFHQ